MKKLVFSTVMLMGLIVASCAPEKAPEPDTDSRDKYVAYWNVSEHSSSVGGTSTHTVNIIKSTTNSGEIILNNFSGLSVSARATVNNNNVTIPYQQIGSIGFTKGSGTMNTSNNSIAMTYTNTIGTSVDTCAAVYSK
jgi:hypothetical protein